MEKSSYIVLFITAATTDEAQQIAKVLLEQKKVACVNVVPRISSYFRWQNKLDSAQESLLIVKTKSSVFAEIVNLVKKVHSYDVPEIIALPILDGNQDYLEWIEKNTS